MGLSALTLPLQLHVGEELDLASVDAALSTAACTSSDSLVLLVAGTKVRALSPGSASLTVRLDDESRTFGMDVLHVSYVMGGSSPTVGVVYDASGNTQYFVADLPGDLSFLTENGAQTVGFCSEDNADFVYVTATYAVTIPSTILGKRVFLQRRTSTAQYRLSNTFTMPPAAAAIPVRVQSATVVDAVQNEGFCTVTARIICTAAALRFANSFSLVQTPYIINRRGKLPSFRKLRDVDSTFAEYEMTLLTESLRLPQKAASLRIRTFCYTVSSSGIQGTPFVLCALASTNGPVRAQAYLPAPPLAASLLEVKDLVTYTSNGTFVQALANDWGSVWMLMQKTVSRQVVLEALSADGAPSLPFVIDEITRALGARVSRVAAFCGFERAVNRVFLACTYADQDGRVCAAVVYKQDSASPLRVAFTAPLQFSDSERASGWRLQWTPDAWSTAFPLVDLRTRSVLWRVPAENAQTRSRTARVVKVTLNKTDEVGQGGAMILPSEYVLPDLTVDHPRIQLDGTLYCFKNSAILHRQTMGLDGNGAPVTLASKPVFQGPPMLSSNVSWQQVYNKLVRGCKCSDVPSDIATIFNSFAFRRVGRGQDRLVLDVAHPGQSKVVAVVVQGDRVQLVAGKCAMNSSTSDVRWARALHATDLVFDGAFPDDDNAANTVSLEYVQVQLTGPKARPSFFGELGVYDEDGNPQYTFHEQIQVPLPARFGVRTSPRAGTSLLSGNCGFLRVDGQSLPVQDMQVGDRIALQGGGVATVLEVYASSCARVPAFVLPNSDVSVGATQKIALPGAVAQQACVANLAPANGALTMYVLTTDQGGNGPAMTRDGIIVYI